MRCVHLSADYALYLVLNWTVSYNQLLNADFEDNLLKKMICCSVLNCPNSFLNNPEKVTFHEFPHDREAVQYWINFTGKYDFVPNFNSKICSAHFEGDAFIRNSKKLKPGAYPTISTIGRKNSFEAEQLHNGNSMRIQRNESNKSSLSCIRNPNTFTNKVMLKKGLHENNTSHPFEASNSNVLNMVSSHTNFPLHNNTFRMPEANNTLVLNYNQNSLGAGAECYFPLKIKVPVNLLRMQMPNVRVLGQNQSTSLALPSSSSYSQPITHMQNQIPQKGPIKVVDMKKLLQAPLEDARNISTNEQDCEIVKHVIHDNKIFTNEQDCEIVKHVIHDDKIFTNEQDCEIVKNVILNEDNISLKPQVNNKNQLQIECTGSNKTKEVELSKFNVPSKVAVSQVLDCLKVILPVKFDLAKLIPNEKVAALVIRYLKLQDDNVTKNSVIMYLRIIVDAAKVKEKRASTGSVHPYSKINDIALQLALEKVLPPNFAMSDVTNLVLNCLCIVLNQDVYIGGYHILRKIIRRLINEGRNCNELSNQSSNMNNLQNKKRTRDEQEEKLPSKKFKLPAVDENEIRVEKLHPKDISVNRLSVARNEKFQSHNKTNISINKSPNSNFRKKEVYNNGAKLVPQSKRLESKFHQSKFYESLKEKSVDGRKKPLKVRVKLEDEEWTMEESVSKKIPNPITAKKPKIGSPENIQLIKSFLRKQHYSPKNVVSNFRNMFRLCRFLRIKSRQSYIQKLNETLISLAPNRRMKSPGFLEERITHREKSNKLKETQEETCTTSLPETHSSNKLKLRPVVILRDLIDYEKEDMLFMISNKDNSIYNNKLVPYCDQLDLPTKKYTPEQVKKLTCESYKKFRRIVVKKRGEKVVFRVKYSKLDPGSLVFVKDFKSSSSGWFKGVINKMVDSLKYVVVLGSGEMWWCAPEQLRPIPQTETVEPNTNRSPRSPRVIKRKQLLDL